MCKDIREKFAELYSLDVNKYVEKKQGLSYLTWSYAWAEFKKIYPDATYEVKKDEQGRCYFGDENIDYSDKDSLGLPMAVLAKYIKETTPNAKVIFIGPCTAKKAEAQLESVKPYVDTVLTFEELQALFDSRDLDIASLEEGVLDNASYFGRIFARSGGLTDAAAQAMKEQNIDFEIKPVVCDGIEACRMALLKLNKGVLDGNFIEGMACIGGCIGGAGCLTHGEKNKAEGDKYGREALEKNISDAISLLK